MKWNALTCIWQTCEPSTKICQGHRWNNSHCAHQETIRFENTYSSSLCNSHCCVAVITAPYSSVSYGNYRHHWASAITSIRHTRTMYNDQHHRAVAIIHAWIASLLGSHHHHITVVVITEQFCTVMIMRKVATNNQEKTYWWKQSC